MITINQIFILQTIIFIGSVPSVTLLHSILNNDVTIEYNFFVKGVIYIVHFYLISSILLILYICSYSLIKETYYEKYFNILFYFSILYDSLLIVVNVMGYIYMLPEITNNGIRKTSSIIIYYLTYQLFSSSQVILNLKTLFCSNIYHLGYRIRPNLNNNTDNSNNDSNSNNDRNNINIDLNNNIRENRRNNMRNNTNNDNQINLNYLRIKNIPEINNENIEYCCICMENIIKVRILPCKHREFCLKCIEKLTEFKCPICRLKFYYVENEIPMLPILTNIITSNT